MMRLFINCLSASAGGGLTYVRNVIPLLAKEPDLQVTVALSRGLRGEFTEHSNLDFLETETSPGRRFWFEQSELPSLIRRAHSDVLLSAGNFAVRKSPVPQILLSRNSLYTSSDFYRDLMSRREYRAWLETRLKGWLAKKSIEWAEVTVAPSHAFAKELERWTGKQVHTIYHGFNYDQFASDHSSLDEGVANRLQSTEGAVRLLFVSHYNYYRNFETLLRALPLLRERMAPRPVRLLLTCTLAKEGNPGSYDPGRASRLIRDMAVSEMVVELGSISYRRLHHLYRNADIYVTPAYTETFAHPLVEAMASGLPVAASDLPVHREICAEAAVYFSPFSSAGLAECISEIANSRDRRQKMVTAGTARVSQFSWKRHVDEILALARTLVA